MIDFHTHIYPDGIAAKGVGFVEDFYGLKASGAGTLEDIRSHMKKAGVSRSVVLSVASRADQVPSINHFLASVLAKDIVGFGAVHPDMEEPETTIEGLIASKMTGVKIHSDMQRFPIDDPRMDRIYDILAEQQIPIMMHMGDARYDFSAPHRLKAVLERHPKLIVIAAHMGGYQRWDEALDCLYGRENVYLDTSSTIRFVPKEYAKKLFASHDPEKIFFGTDYPLATPEQELKDLESLHLGSRFTEQILSRNAERFLTRYGPEILS